jgi:hypothetical protein
MAESSPISLKKGVMKTYSDDANEMIFSLSAQQRNSLLMRYADADSEKQTLLDSLLQSFVKADHQLLIKFKAELEKESMGKLGKLMNVTKGLDGKLASQSMNLEHMKFWYENSTRAIEERPTPEESAILKKLTSYVPKVVIRRLFNNPTKIVAPEIESFESCLVFADISGFTPLTEKMAQLGPEGNLLKN